MIAWVSGGGGGVNAWVNVRACLRRGGGFMCGWVDVS